MTISLKDCVPSPWARLHALHHVRVSGALGAAPLGGVVAERAAEGLQEGRERCRAGRLAGVNWAGGASAQLPPPCARPCSTSTQSTRMHRGMPCWQPLSSSTHTREDTWTAHTAIHWRMRTVPSAAGAGMERPAQAPSARSVSTQPAHLHRQVLHRVHLLRHLVLGLQRAQHALHARVVLLVHRRLVPAQGHGRVFMLRHVQNASTSALSTLEQSFLPCRQSLQGSSIRCCSSGASL